ncbi:MAG TPA: hypothetical protein VFP84_09775, partial [Kofleriaceae bacterium]|nr:hypothetical protein [Kofleriaceae bacterium]
ASGPPRPASSMLHSGGPSPRDARTWVTPPAVCATNSRASSPARPTIVPGVEGSTVDAANANAGACGA